MSENLKSFVFKCFTYIYFSKGTWKRIYKWSLVPKQSGSTKTFTYVYLTKGTWKHQLKWSVHHYLSYAPYVALLFIYVYFTKGTWPAKIVGTDITIFLMHDNKFCLPTFTKGT